LYNIARMKETLKSLIEEHESKIQHYDKILVEMSMAQQGEVKLSPDENTQYLLHMSRLEKYKIKLYQLRLRGDEFRIIHKNQNKLLKITSELALMFAQIKRTSNPQDIVPTDMSQYAYFNVGIVEGKEGSTIYEITSALSIHYIDQVQSIVLDNSISEGRNGGCCIFWKNGKKSSFVAAIPGEAEELVEVVKSHLKKFKQATIRQIQLLKDIFKCKSTKFDSSLPEHEALLKRLWVTVKPDLELTGLISNQWKILGFQGNNPSTDFRGMGLLGLLNLIYFAENYTEKVKELIHSDREYPWATTGINLTHMILSVLNLTKELVNQPVGHESWQTPLLHLFYYANHDDTFDELYSQAFLLFDRLWVHMKAKYMDFSSVIRRLQQIMEETLQRKPLDVNQLIAWIEQLQISYL